MIRKCRDCEASFQVDQAEQQWCRTQGMGQPRRCLSCRAERRHITDQKVSCARCGTEFVYSRELAVLVTTFSWTPPSRCIGGCDAGARKNLRGERKKLAEVVERMNLAVKEEEARVAASPVKPGDLFKGLDALLEKAAAAEAAKEAEEQAKEELEEAGAGPLTPKPRGGEDLPSPDDLFRGLESKSRKTSLD